MMIKRANASIGSRDDGGPGIIALDPCRGGATNGCGPAAWPKPLGILVWRAERGPESGLIHMLPGMIGTADEGTGLDVAKAHRHRPGLKLGELGGRNVALDRQMVA